MILVMLNEKRTIRKVLLPADGERIMEVFSAAKGIMRASGNIHQWSGIMQHVIQDYGFTYCGIIYLANGDERLAYQKTIGQLKHII